MPSYYEQMQRSKSRVRNTVIPLVKSGEKVTVIQILYDLDNSQHIYSKKGVIEYLERMAEVEGWKFDGDAIYEFQ